MAPAAKAVLTATVTELATAGLAVVDACVLVGMPRSSFYRSQDGSTYRPVADPIPQACRAQPAALTDDERAGVVAVLDDDEFAGLSVYQLYWRAFDAGRVVCSQRTFYRIAGAQGLVGDRRRGRHSQPATSRRKPSCPATRPNELWSWDFTELHGPGRHRYQLAVVLDVYSRYPIAWRIDPCACKYNAGAMFTTAFDTHGAPGTVHADNGASMRSHHLAEVFAQHDVNPSFSRPHVSDDNPFSEAMFKTIKYDTDYPEQFTSIDHARTWTDAFFDRYAHHHRHSGLGHHTPASVHHGTVNDITRARQARLDTYYAEHPERFRRPPTTPGPQPTGINVDLSQTG